ncbi:MAG: tetratricopeptide repeat protein [Verrucomicrobiota bacterium]
MLKYISIAILTVLVALSWYKFDQSGKTEEDLSSKIEKLEYNPDTEEEARELKKKLNGMAGERIFTGILLTFLSAGLVGIVFVTQVLPMLANKVSTAVYSSDEKVEADPFHDARVLMAQGDWEGAIASFKLAAQKDPSNRMTWTEIAKIQRQHQENPPAAIATLRQAIESQDWEVDDVAFLMFRLAEIYEEDFHDHATAGSVLSQIIELFPETRHSANARTKLHHYGV